jgi:hypothetical protein
MDVVVKYKGKWVKASIQFTEILTVDRKVVDFNENLIAKYFKMTHIGNCIFKGDMFSAYVPDETCFVNELVILFGNINFIYSKK